MYQLTSLFSFSIDPLSFFFFAVILLVSVPSAIHAVGYLRGEYSRNKSIFAGALITGFVLSMLVVVTASNALFFLVAWEMMSLLSYFLVVFDSERAASVKAGLIYIVMTHVATAFIITAFLILHHHAGTFDLIAFKNAAAALPAPTRNLLFLLFLAGFGTKAGMIPLHVWLPYAHPRAPSPVSAIMSGVMIKTAVYGIIRFVIMVLGGGAWWWGNVIVLLAAASCLGGVIYALMERDLKRLLAYSSVENIGIIFLGVGASMVFIESGNNTAAILALSAALYHTLNHSVFKSLLFLSAGNIYKATGLRDSEALGGLVKKMPWTAAGFLAGAMAISALPPFSGFVSEWLTFQALFLGAFSGTTAMKISMSLYASVLALTGGLAAACFVKAFGITFLAKPRSRKAQEAREVSPVMIAPVIFLALGALILGLGAPTVLVYLKDIAAFASGIDGAAVQLKLNNLVLSPTAQSGAYLSVPLIAMAVLGAAAAVYAAVRFAFGKNIIATSKTWGCGYYRLDARAEYTATAFSKPFRIAFSFLLKPYRKIEKIKESPYHIKHMRYEVYTTPIIKTYLYESALNMLLRSARILRRLQTGSLHIYISYIFIVIVLLILFI